MTPYYSRSGITLYHGDCREVLPALADESVDAVVCDPPYDLLQASRKGSPRTNVGKPGNPYGRSGGGAGGFMGLAWDATGIAFHKETWEAVLRVLKPGGHLLAAGGTRTYHRMTCAIEDAGFEVRDCLAWHYGTGFPKSLNVGDGRGTALKPAFEPFVLARKPLVGTVAANVSAHGTGALNVDACRIGTTKRVPASTGSRNRADLGCGWGLKASGDGANHDPNVGRFPANVLFSHLPDCTDAACAPGCAVAELDAQSGELGLSAGGGMNRASKNPTSFGATERNDRVKEVGFGDTGGASRFFYCAKPSPDERDGNTHPTVKPIALMRWLCRLVVPPNGLVLDAFAGSGTTGVAAIQEGFCFVGIERESKYIEIAAKRLDRELAQGDLFVKREVATNV